MTPDERKAWVASLKVGDRVIIDGKRRSVVEKIERGCPTAGGIKFDRKGFDRTETWHQHTLEPWDDAVAAQIAERVKREKLEQRVRSAPFHSLSVDQLEQIAAIIYGDGSLPWSTFGRYGKEQPK